MEFNEVLRKRRMVRSFKTQSLSPEKIEALLRNAHRTPSAGFLQQQEYVVVKNLDVKRKLAEAAVGQDFIAEAPVVIIVCSNTDRVVKRYGERGVKIYSVIDGAFASMLILLTAVNEGLGACFVGAFEDEKVSEILELPKSVRPVGIIPVGYSDEPPEKLTRMSLKQIVHYETYGNKEDRDFASS